MTSDPTPRLLHAIEKDGLDVHNRIHIIMKELGCRHTYERFKDFEHNRWSSTK